jgi:hypothetical protein
LQRESADVPQQEAGSFGTRAVGTLQPQDEVAQFDVGAEEFWDLLARWLAHWCVGVHLALRWFRELMGTASIQT